MLFFSPGNLNQFHKTLKDMGPHFSKGSGCLKKLIAGSGNFFPPFVYGEAIGGVAGFLPGKGSGSQVSRTEEGSPKLVAQGKGKEIKMICAGGKGGIPGPWWKKKKKKTRRRESCLPGVSALSSLLTGKGFLTLENPCAFE